MNITKNPKSDAMPTDQMFATSLGEFMVVGDFIKELNH